MEAGFHKRELKIKAANILKFVLITIYIQTYFESFSFSKSSFKVYSKKLDRINFALLY